MNEETAILEATPVHEATEKAASLIAVAEAVAVNSNEDVEAVSAHLKEIAGIKKTLEEQRQFFVRPLNEQVAKINALFKRLSEPVLRADAILRKKVSDFRIVQAEEARKEQARLAKLAAQRQERANVKAEAAGTPPPIVPVPIVAPPPKTVGSVTARKVWKFKVLDPKLVPAQFWVIDESAIGAAVRAGLRTIPGVQIYEEEVISVR